jgi:hypothetical protein
MSLTDRIVLIVGLCEIVMPDRTILLTDGGFLDWPAKGLFTAKDVDFGAIESLEYSGEEVSDEAPGGRLTLLPPGVAAAGDLFRSDVQGSPLRFWLAVADRDTGLIVGDPELLFDGLIDTVSLRVSREGRFVDVEFMANAERLFFVREGNVLTSRFHNLAWPGEKGLDHTTGSSIQTPWGVPDPGRGSFLGGLVGRIRDARRGY